MKRKRPPRPLFTWRASLVVGKGLKTVGLVDAPDEATALAEALIEAQKIYKASDNLAPRLVVRRVD